MRSAARNEGGNSLKFWTRGEELGRLDIEPRLASWNHRADPEQLRLQAYLQEVKGALVDSLPVDRPVFVNVEVVLSASVNLLHHRDLENYLTPLGSILRAHELVLARATKRHARDTHDVSCIRVGHAIDGVRPRECALYARAHGSVEKVEWKRHLRQSVSEQVEAPAPPGPLDLDMALGCGASRNWVNLWKPAGDALGPLLGEPHPKRPYHPADDRITKLGLHLSVDASLGFDVDVCVWCSPSVQSSP